MVIVISIDRMTSSEIIANRSRYHSKAVGGEICATTPVHEQVGFNGLLVAVGHILIGMEGSVTCNRRKKLFMETNGSPFNLNLQE